MNTLIEVWKAELAESRFRVQAVLSILALILTLSFFTKFLIWVEARPGVTLADPILRMITPVDLTWLTFGLIYVAVLVAIATLFNKPRDLLLAIQSYTIMVWARGAMMYLVPLNPPEGLIVLQDPLVQFFGDGNAPTKDLFFSGHTSTMFILLLVTRQRKLKAMFLLFTLVVALAVVWQHVHYVIDVAGAPFVAYGCYRLAMKIEEW
ncbi:MAG: phosphatase PAP2 family protein [Ignavibacteriae bacterium]|nr:phosphatase PAP2 family protein [Ignavibacteriota bacterium]